MPTATDRDRQPTCSSPATRPGDRRWVAMAPSGRPSRVTGTRPHPRRSRARRTSRVRTPRTSHPVSAAPGCEASPSLTATMRTSTPWSHNICNRPPHPRISSSGWGDTTHARRLDGTSKGGRERRGWDRRQVASLVPRCWSSTTKLTQSLRPPRGPRAPRPGARGVELGRRTGLRRAGLVAHRGREAQLLRLRPRARAPAGRAWWTACRVTMARFRVVEEESVGSASMASAAHSRSAVMASTWAIA